MLRINQQILDIRRSAFSCVRSSYRIRRFISVQSARVCFTSLFISQLDYCNALYGGINKTQSKLLQSILNTGVRIIFRLPRSAHVSPSLIRLRWLPAIFRVNFKICVLVHKCIYGNAPVYLKDLLSPAHSSNIRSLRSSHAHFLYCPRHRFRRCGAFFVYAPKQWNFLPARALI